MTDEKRVWCNKHNRFDLDGCQYCEREKRWGERKERLMSVLVEVGLDVITAEGERSEEEGWREIVDRVNAALKREFDSDMTAGCLNANVEEWLT